MEVFKTVVGIHDEMKSNHAQVTGILKDITNSLQGLSQPTLKADTGLLPLPAELQADHLDIKYWTQKEYQQAKKNQKRSTSIQDLDADRNIMTWFVEEDDGEPVDNDMVKAIQTVARSIWFELLRRGIAPETWEKAGLDARNYFKHHMCH
ncbi:hypothetical protein C0991_010566 [Blastosporella zonata]|nr:hypothetical protein C0991_010566 [Blastosporella zonata]